MIESKIEELKTRCRREGIPLTLQKIEVYKAVLNSHDHPSPEAIYNSLKDKFSTLSLATVYNNLESLGRLGMIRRVNPLSDQARYDGDLSTHYHFVCIKCKKVEDIQDQAVNSIKIPDLHGSENKILGKTIQLTGICKECQKDTLEEK